jgi:hypothetical protein
MKGLYGMICSLDIMVLFSQKDIGMQFWGIEYQVVSRILGDQCIITRPRANGSFIRLLLHGPFLCSLVMEV